jgi:very-short-patch-repair endonuclease
VRPGRAPIDVTAGSARPRRGIALHRSRLRLDERTAVDGIPTTTVARTLFDFAEIVDEDGLRRVAEEADRLRLLNIRELELICAQCPGRRAVGPIRRLIEATQTAEDTQSPLEDQVLDLCRAHDLPLPATGAVVLGKEVDAFWPAAKLMIEADSWQHHGHRAAFERDRDRDAAMQVEGYRVIRLTHRRMKREPAAVADQIRRLLKAAA